MKKIDIFLISPQKKNIWCGYSLSAPQPGPSNEYLQCFYGDTPSYLGLCSRYMYVRLFLFYFIFFFFLTKNIDICLFLHGNRFVGGS